MGRLVPGEVDHVAVFVGPSGRCVEAGPRGVALFNLPGESWNAESMAIQRGLLLDSLSGVVSPLQGLDLSTAQEMSMRQKIAAYCLAQLGKPYNLNFIDSEIETAFYCSQLAYKAYQQVGVNLNTGLMIEHLAGTNRIIFPQEIWGGFPHREAIEQTEAHAHSQ